MSITIKAVKANPFIIREVLSPPVHMQIAAVRKYPFLIAEIDNRSSKVELIAVSSCWKFMRYIKDPDQFFSKIPFSPCLWSKLYKHLFSTRYWLEDTKLLSGILTLSERIADQSTGLSLKRINIDPGLGFTAYDCSSLPMNSSLLDCTISLCEMIDSETDNFRAEKCTLNLTKQNIALRTAPIISNNAKVKNIATI